MLPRTTPLSNSRRAEIYLGLGLVTLIAIPWLRIAPFVTAVAVICLGATEITLARFEGKPALVPVLVLHAVTYTVLYALFVGAVLHALSEAHTVALSRFALLDLTISTFPMTTALKRISNALGQPPLSQH